MSSSQGASSYFRSHGRQIADIEPVFAVSRRFDLHRQSRQDDAFGSRRRRRERRLEEPEQRRRGWSDGGRWSVIGRSRLVLVLLAVTYQSLVVVDSSGQRELTSVIQLSPCRALVNDSLIDLGRHLYRPTNVTAR